MEIVNFIDSRPSQEIVRTRYQVKKLIAGYGLLIIIFAIISSIIYAQYYHHATEHLHLMKQLNNHQKPLAPITSLHEQKIKKKLWEMVTHSMQHIPHTVTLKKIIFTAAGSITLEGYTAHYKDIQAYEAALQKNIMSIKVQQDSVEKNTSSSTLKDQYVFRLTLLEIEPK